MSIARLTTKLLGTGVLGKARASGTPASEAPCITWGIVRRIVTEPLRDSILQCALARSIAANRPQYIFCLLSTLGCAAASSGTQAIAKQVIRHKTAMKVISPLTSTASSCRAHAHCVLYSLRVPFSRLDFEQLPERDDVRGKPAE